MNETRKKIIIQEIKYWKQNKMLPEKYCDFLLTLYSGGEENITPTKKQRSISIYIPLWIFTVIFFTILFVNYFTEIPKGLQITLTAIAIIIFCFLIVRYIDKSLLFQLALVCLALLILIESVNIVNLLFPKSNDLLYFILLLQCVGWVLVGRKWHLLYFWISGILGAIIIISFLVKDFY